MEAVGAVHHHYLLSLHTARFFRYCSTSRMRSTSHSAFGCGCSGRRPDRDKESRDQVGTECQCPSSTCATFRNSNGDQPGLALLNDLNTLIITGQYPASLSHWFNSNRLSMFHKDYEGDPSKLRPIECGSAIRRIIASHANNKTSQNLQK